MGTRVDISSPELDPHSVLEFIIRHTLNRPPRNILFKVSEQVLMLHKKALTDITTVSPKEAEKLNELLGAAGAPEDYLISGGAWKCSSCERTLTFYDVFLSGKDQHGRDFLMTFLKGDGYHIQIAREDSHLGVHCTECGTINELMRPMHYSGQNYTYA